MTITKALEITKEMMPAAVSEEQLLRWLSALDGQIKLEIIDTHAGAEKIIFAGYDAQTDLDTALLAKPPYDEMYPYFLMAQVLFANGEMEEYNVVAARYNELYAAFAAYYNRTHMPVMSGGWRW